MKRWPVLVAALLVAGVAGRPSAAQTVRGWATSTVQAVELRPWVSLSDCIAGCIATSEERLAAVGTQDVRLSAWGLGVTGLSATLYARARTDLGSEVPWPRSGDRVDLLLGDVRWVGGPWSARLGRQEIRGGLGFSSFDGAWVGRRSRERWFEGYVGRSLARGLRAPANEALAGLDDFLPDRGAVLVGGALGGRLGSMSATLRYQREILTDRSALVSERASVDGAARTGRIRWVGNADWDFQLGRPGKAAVTASRSFSGTRQVLSISGRRYVPYFSMSTIWGLFEPVAYHEIEARGASSVGGTAAVWLSAGWRRYGDAGVVEVLSPLSDTGWRGAAGGRWQAADAWALEGSWRLEWGPGGFLHSADADVVWSVADDAQFRIGGGTLQQIEQYRLGDGRALAGRASGRAGLSDRVAAEGGLSLLHHSASSAGEGVSGAEWTQARAWASIRVRFGTEPTASGGLRR